MIEDSTNLLVVICDTNPGWWANHDAVNDEKSSFKHCMESLLVFCNSYIMINHTNKLVFIACHPNECCVVYPTRNTAKTDSNEGNSPKDGKFEAFVDMNNIVMGKLQEMVKQENPDDTTSAVQPLLLSGALTKALCYIHNHSVTKDGCARIFIMKASPDTSAQYMSIMNCIFAAQKKRVVIDSCSLLGHSGFLQQASDITDGTYFNVENLGGMLEYLLWVFLPEPAFRSKLHVPSALQIDYRAACFCHKQLVDVGFVCSVCLSIYCQFMPKCLTCQTRFKLPQLSMSKPKKRRKDITA